MSNSESIYSKISKMMLSIEIVETIYDRQKNESSVPEQIYRSLVIFTFFVNKYWFVGKEESWPNF